MVDRNLRVAKWRRTGQFGIACHVQHFFSPRVGSFFRCLGILASFQVANNSDQHRMGKRAKPMNPGLVSLPTRLTRRSSRPAPIAYLGGFWSRLGRGRLNGVVGRKRRKSRAAGSTTLAGLGGTAGKASVTHVWQLATTLKHYGRGDKPRPALSIK